MTAWDVSTKVYETSSSVGLGEINPTGMFFNPDGTKLYAIGDTQDKFLQYTCSTPWDVSTKVYETSSSVGLGETLPYGMFFKSDGTKLYAIGSGQAKFLQFDCSTPWDVSTASYETSSSVGLGETAPRHMFFKSDGTKLYAIGLTIDKFLQYTCSTPWDVSTKVYETSSSVGLGEGTPRGMFFKSDGTKLYAIGDTQDKFLQYTCSTPWDVSTKVYETSSSVGLGETAPRPMFFKSDGTKLYVIGSGQDKFLQFDLSGSEPPAGENIYINIDDSYKQVAAAYVNVDDAWKEVTDIYVNVDDTWKAV